jgi:hypothetical protein
LATFEQSVSGGNRGHLAGTGQIAAAIDYTTPKLAYIKSATAGMHMPRAAAPRTYATHKAHASARRFEIIDIGLKGRSVF